MAFSWYLKSLFLVGIKNLVILANSILFANNSTAKLIFECKIFLTFGEEKLKSVGS